MSLSQCLEQTGRNISESIGWQSDQGEVLLRETRYGWTGRDSFLFANGVKKGQIVESEKEGMWSSSLFRIWYGGLQAALFWRLNDYASALDVCMVGAFPLMLRIVLMVSHVT